MKTLYMIGGTMGIGKTTVCRVLQKKLPDAVFLDGDWCWDADPFRVTEETKRMVIENICFLLNRFIQCSAYENVIFCWVMHEQAIIDDILGRLELSKCAVKCVSLIITPEALTERLTGDIEKGIRTPDVLERSLRRIPLYDRLDTIRIDASRVSPEKLAELLAELQPQKK